MNEILNKLNELQSDYFIYKDESLQTSKIEIINEILSLSGFKIKVKNYAEAIEFFKIVNPQKTYNRLKYFNSKHLSKLDEAISKLYSKDLHVIIKKIINNPQ